MADVALNRTLWIAGHDLTGDLNAIALDDGVELRTAGVFGDTAQRRRAGLFGATLEAEGYRRLEADSPEAALDALLGFEDVPVTIGGEEGGLDGQVAYLFRAITARYHATTTHGEMAAFSASAEGSAGEPLVRGRIVHPKAARTASGVGAGQEFAVLADGQKLYTALHVFAITAGATLTVTVQSGGSTFPAPVARVVVPAQTALGAAWGPPLVGPITPAHVHWRVAYTLTGPSAACTFAVALGIV